MTTATAAKQAQRTTAKRPSLFPFVGAQPAPFTQSQRQLLTHMIRNNIGTFYCDPLRKWIWKSDVRENADLAAVAVKFLGPTVQS